jgi:coenzyme F420-reducing hydrogenase gamma subunit
MIKSNKFIKNLALDLKGNTLILFAQELKVMGNLLYEMINKSINEDRHVFFVHGGVDTEDREKVREITEKENNAIIVASYGTFSVQELTLKICIMLSLLLQVNQELEIFNQLEEF